MSHPTQTKTLTAGGTIANRRIVVPHGSNAGQVIQASAATGALMGVVDQPGGVTAGQRVDIHVGGLPEVEAGAAIAAGALVTADSSGRAVTAAPSAGVNNRVIGVAFDAAAANGDLIRIIISPGSVQG